MISKVSAYGVKFTSGFEGYRSVAYQDKTGTWTIGYGHTNGVSAGQTITNAQGLALLASDMVRVESALNDENLNLTQNQYDALADLLFNAGTGVLTHFTPLIRANPLDSAITDKINEYKYSKGVVLQDLIDRRASEVELYKKKTK